MSIDRIYREFFGFSLIILSLFLFVSLLTFSAQDNIFNAFELFTDIDKCKNVDELFVFCCVDNCFFNVTFVFEFSINSNNKSASNSSLGILAGPRRIYSKY